MTHDESSSQTRTFRFWATGIIAVHMTLWTIVMAGGWLYWDDFILQGQAARLGLTADLLLNNHDGHVMPLTYAVVWAIQELSGLNYALVAATMAVGQVVFVLAAVLAVRALLGRTVPAIVALAVFLLTPLLIPAVTWWAAALTVVPFVTCTLFATVSLLHYYRTGSRGALITTFALVVVALGFFEKSLLIPVWLFLVTALVEPDPSFWHSARTALRTRWRLWVAWAGLLAVYLLGFAQVAEGRTRIPTGPGQVFELLTRAFFNTLAPGLAGGPLRWTSVDYSASYSDPPVGMIAFGTVVTLGFIWLGVRRPGVARKAWIVAGLYLCVDLATFAVGRLGPDGDPGVVQAARYVASSLFGIAIAIGATVAQNRELLRRYPIPSAALGSVVASLAAISTLAYAAVWSKNPAEAWVGQAREDLAAADQAVPLLDQDVPDFLLLPVTHPYNQASWFLAPLPVQPGFASSTPELQVIDNRGALVPAKVVGHRSLPTPDGCYAVEPDAPAVIPLENSLIAWAHTVAIDYTAERGGFINVAIGAGEPVAASVRPGRNTLFVRAEGGENTVTISSPDTAVCVAEVTVGRVEPGELLYGGDVDITDELRQRNGAGAANAED